MSLSNPVDLLDVHSELSCILHAATEELKDLNCTCNVSYNPHTYLNLEVECWGDDPKRMQAVIDRLHHGILWGGYDYRFRGISHTPLNRLRPYEANYVTAIIDMSNSKRQRDTWRLDHPRERAYA